MRIASVGSGSRGNAILIESFNTLILIDCGFSYKEFTSRLRKLNRSPGDINAILVTHEHADHIKGVEALATKHKIPVYATRGTLIENKTFLSKIAHTIHGEFVIDSFEIHPVTVPHNAREPVQFYLISGGKKILILSDLGFISPRVSRLVRDIDALVCEFNYDEAMLERGPYPRSIKDRVSGPLGHLSNRQAIRLVKLANNDRLRLLIATHLSAKNNEKELVLDLISQAISGFPIKYSIAEQETTLDWQIVH